MSTLTESPWPNVRLGDVGQSLIGLTYSPSNVKHSGTLVLRSSNIQDGSLAFDDNVYVDCAIPEKIRVRENDILICVRNGSRRLIGKSVILDHRVVGQTFGAFMAVYRSHSNPFLQYFFQSNDFKRQIDEHLGATINQITNGSLNSFVVALPSKPEQQAITARLQDIDQLIDGLQRLIAKKQAIKQGMMQQLLTGRTRLPGFTDSWQRLAVASRSMMKARIGWQGLKTDEYRESGTYRLVGGTEFVDGRIDWNQAPFVDKWRYDQDAYIQLRVGDVLLTKDGTIGKIAYVDALPGPATLNSGVFVLRPIRNAYDPAFLYWMLRSRAFDEFLGRLTAGSTISHLYQRDLVTLVLDVPSTVDEQRAIAGVLDDTEEEISVLQQRLAKARAIKTGMMQQLLTGRVQLPVEAAA